MKKKNAFISTSFIFLTMVLVGCESEEGKQIDTLIEDGFSEEEAEYMLDLTNELYGDDVVGKESEEEVVVEEIPEVVYEVPEEIRIELETTINEILELQPISQNFIEKHLYGTGYEPKDVAIVLEEMNIDWVGELVRMAEKYGEEEKRSRYWIVESLVSEGFKRDFSEEHVDKANIDYKIAAINRALYHRNRSADIPERWMDEENVRYNLRKYDKFTEEQIEEAISNIEFYE